MKSLYKHLTTNAFIYAGLLIYGLFCLSVLKTGWLNIFFPREALHINFAGIDFYQIPRGAWSYWHGGGSMTGKGAAYAKEIYYVNDNVYHPFFTLLLGSVLMLFQPDTAYWVWMWAKMAISLVAAGYFYWSFRGHKHIQFAVFIILANFSSYLELAAGQFQLVLNVCLLLFLVQLARRKTVLPAFWYAFSLIVKPVGLLFAPALLAKRRYSIVVIAVGMFLLETIYFWITGLGGYYVSNLAQNIFNPVYTSGSGQILTLTALLHVGWHWPDAICSAIQNLALALIVFLATLRRIHPLKAIFLATVYFLCFYTLVYEYDYSTLAYVLAVCIVVLPEFQTPWARLCAFLTCLSSCFVVLRALGITGVSAPSSTAWAWMIISKLVPIALLCVCVLAKDVKPTLAQARVFWRAMQKVNGQEGMFGPEN